MSSTSAPSVTSSPEPRRDDLRRALAAPRLVRVTIDNPMVAAALTATIAQRGWTAISRPDPQEVLVTDRLLPRSLEWPRRRHLILVCEPTALAARHGLDALAGVMVHGLVCSDQPADLVSALDGLRNGRSTIPLRVLELAAEMPPLSERELMVLGAVIAGQSNTEIGNGLYLSLATVKRVMATLFAVLDAPSRPALVGKALELGMKPLPVRP